MTNLFHPARAGEFLRGYRPRANLNALINLLFSRPRAYTPKAVIVREVQFPDVSFYQGVIDFEVMSARTRAIIIRAGQNLWTDDQFERNYAEAVRKNLLKGVYWFYDGRVSPGAQAEHLISILRGKKLEMEVYIDWERNYGGSHEGLANVVAMMQVIEQAGLDIPGVGLYTGYYFFRSNSNPITNASQYNYLKTRPLWLAWYTSNPANVLIPAPWTDLTHWQFGTPVVAWGQQTSELDMNFFNGSSADFNQRYGSASPPPNGGSMDYYELRPSIAGEWRSVRQETSYPTIPHILGSKINQINANSYARAYSGDYYVYQNDVYINGVIRAKAGDTWWRTYEVNGVSYAGWVAEIHLGKTYLTKTFFPSTPPAKPTLTHTIEIFNDGSIKVDGNSVP